MYIYTTVTILRTEFVVVDDGSLFVGQCGRRCEHDSCSAVLADFTADAEGSKKAAYPNGKQRAEGGMGPNWSMLTTDVARMTPAPLGQYSYIPAACLVIGIMYARTRALLRWHTLSYILLEF